MRTKDALLLGILGAVFLALLAPALFHPSRVLGNFGDVYAFHYPLQHLTTSRLQSGEMPFWNPYIFSGLPLLAESQAAVFYPLSAPLRLFPLKWAFTLYAALHLALAALGMQLLLRQRRLDAGAAAMLAGAFALSPFLIYRIPQGIPTHLAALSYVPWCWLALGARRPWLLAGVWSLQFLSGHPQFPAINAAAMALCALAERRKALAFLSAGAAAAFLCLVQLAPTFEFIRESNRVGWPAAFAGAYSLPWEALWTLVLPSFAGTPLDGTFGSVPSVFFESYVNYVGWVPLGFALWALARRRDARPAWALAALGLFLALGVNNPLNAELRGVPLVSLSRVPARFGLFIVWGLLMAAARGLAGARLGPRLKAALFVAVLADLGLWSARFVYAEEAKGYLDPSPLLRWHLAGNLVRFASGPDLANPNKAMLYRAMNVNGYSAYYLKRYAEYAFTAEKGPAADPSRTYIRNVWAPEIRKLGAAYYLSAEAPSGGGAPAPGTVPAQANPMKGGISAGGGAVLYPNRGAFPLVYLDSPAGAERVDWGNGSAERWRAVVAPQTRSRELVMATPLYPGWRAWTSGRPVRPALKDGLVMSVPVEPSPAPATVDFRFQPTGWPLLCLLSAAAWLAWLFRAREELLA